MSPVYDFKCPECEQKKEDVFLHHHDTVVNCDQCRIPMKKLFPNSAKYIGAKCFPAEGIFLEHVCPGGKRFYSEKEMRDHEKRTGDTIARLH